MEHPFMPSLENKTIEEIQAEITKLNNKLNFAYRTGNSPLINQLLMYINGYNNEYNKRMNELFAKQKIDSKINVQ